MRSSSPALNKLLAGSLGSMLASGLYPHLMYYPTERSPADGLTRGRDPPLPTLPLPGWWKDSCEGRAESFDAWIDGVSGSQVLDCGHISPFENVDSRSALRVKVDATLAENARVGVDDRGVQDEAVQDEAVKTTLLPGAFGVFHERQFAWGPDIHELHPARSRAQASAVERALLRHKASLGLEFGD